MARWIGIDFGNVRTGIAYTDESERMAFPFATVPTAELMTVLERLINESPCRGLVLGIPNAWGVALGKAHTHSTEPILAFRVKLQKRWPDLPIELTDETNTSEEALQASIAGGMKKSKRSKKGALDNVAAAIILQRFLDNRNVTG
jgi:putative holliday junction resolvase